jgi:T3SS negative regulator,GrlR
MEGFWTVQFSGVQGWGAGVLTLIGGKIFGGDTSFLYTGTYVAEGTKITGHVHVKRHAAGLPNVMGRDEFDLELNGTLKGSLIALTAKIPGTQLQLSGTLTKQGDLPANATSSSR